MATTEPLTGARIPSDSDSPLGGTAIARAIQDLADETVPSFATSGARDTAYANWVASGKTMRDGLCCVVGGQFQMYRSGSWTTAVNFAALRAAGDLVADGTVSAANISGTTLRATSAGDVSATSTGHALQAGPTTGLNIALDGNEIMGRNNGALSELVVHNAVAATPQGPNGNAFVRRDYVDPLFSMVSRFHTYDLRFPSQTISGTNNIPTPTLTIPAQSGPYAVIMSAAVDVTLAGSGAPSLQLFFNGTQKGDFVFTGVNGTNTMFSGHITRTIAVPGGESSTVFARINLPAGVSAVSYADDRNSFLSVQTVPIS